MAKFTEYLGALLNEVPGDALEASRTATIALAKVSGRNRSGSPELLRMTAVLDRTAGTNLTAALSVSLDGGTTYGRVESIAVAAGTGTLSDYTPTKTLSADIAVDLQLDVRGATHAKVVLASASANSSDKISLLASLYGEV